MNVKPGEDPHCIYTSTAYIQEVHLMILHMWCVCIDAAFRNESQEESKRG